MPSPPTTAVNPAWVPVMAAAMSAIASPFLAYLLMKKERRRTADHTEQLDTQKIQSDIIEAYHQELSRLSERTDRVDKESAEWQAKYWQLISEKLTGTEEYLRKVEIAGAERAKIEGEKLLLIHRLFRMERDVEQLLAIIERTREPLTADDKMKLYVDRVTNKLKSATAAETETE